MPSTKERAIKRLQLVAQEFGGSPAARHASTLGSLLASDEPDPVRLGRQLHSFANAAANYAPPKKTPKRTAAAKKKKRKATTTPKSATKKATHTGRSKTTSQSTPSLRYNSAVFKCLDDLQTCRDSGRSAVTCVSLCAICISNQMHAFSIAGGTAVVELGWKLLSGH